MRVGFIFSSLVILVGCLAACESAPTRGPASTSGAQTFSQTIEGRRKSFTLKGCHYQSSPTPIEPRLIGLRQNQTQDGDMIDRESIDNEGKAIACPEINVLISGRGIRFPRVDTIHARAQDNCEYSTNDGPLFCTTE